MTYLLITLTVLIALVVYHHVGYVTLLKLTNKVTSKRTLFSKNSKQTTRFGILICAYNEQDHIKEKLHNLGALLYDNQKYAIHVYLDGCTDNTYEEAIMAQSQLAKQNVLCHLHFNKLNRGKSHGKCN